MYVRFSIDAEKLCNTVFCLYTFPMHSHRPSKTFGTLVRTVCVVYTFPSMPQGPGETVGTGTATSTKSVRLPMQNSITELTLFGHKALQEYCMLCVHLP